MFEAEHFDESQSYEDEVGPLVSQLYDACERHGVPFMFVALVKNDEESYGVTRSQFVPKERMAPVLYAPICTLDDNEAAQEAIKAFAMNRALAQGDSHEH